MASRSAVGREMVVVGEGERGEMAVVRWGDLRRRSWWAVRVVGWEGGPIRRVIMGDWR